MQTTNYQQFSTEAEAALPNMEQLLELAIAEAGERLKGLKPGEDLTVTVSVPTTVKFVRRDGAVQVAPEACCVWRRYRFPDGDVEVCSGSCCT